MSAFCAQQLLAYIFIGAFPAFGIIIPSSGTGQDSNPTDYLAPYGSVIDGVNLNGVVFINTGGITCSGSLISPTQVLTAAHCFGGNPASTIVNFQNSANAFDAIDGTSVIDPDYQQNLADGADLAIVNLATTAPSYATIYQLYTGAVPYGSTIAVVGFGDTGTGDLGYSGGDGTRMMGENSYVMNAAAWYGSTVSTNLQLGDFENGTTAANTLGATGLDSLGVMDEVDVSYGDSGGPSFYAGQLIGVHDFIDCAPSSDTCPYNSTYGEIFGDTGVAGDAAWLNLMLTPEPSSWLLCLAVVPVITLLGRRRLRR